jgi:hypothetical protein
MKNLTEIFKKVITSNVNWSSSLFYLVLETLRSSNINFSFWEGEENWASILINNKPVGYVWKKHPLIILEKEVGSQIKNVLKSVDEVYFVEVDSLGKDLFKIEDDEIKRYFENFNDFNSFTIDDFWFQTNSI